MHGPARLDYRRTGPQFISKCIICGLDLTTRNLVRVHRSGPVRILYSTNIFVNFVSTVYGKTFEGGNFRGWNRKGSFTGKRSR